MDDVIIYNVAPNLSDADLVELISSTRRFNHALSPLCRERIRGMYQQRPSMCNPDICNIDRISIEEYNRRWNTNYSNYSDLFVVHYRYIFDVKDDNRVIDNIIRGRYYDVVVQRVVSMDHILTAEALLTDDPMLIKYVDKGIKYIYDHVYEKGDHCYYYFMYRGNWSSEFTELYMESHGTCTALAKFLYNIDNIYPVLHKIPCLPGIIDEHRVRNITCASMNFSMYFFHRMLSLSNLSRYIHYIEHFGVTNRWWLLGNIMDKVMNRSDKIESPDIVRRFMVKFLDVVGKDYYVLGSMLFRVKNGEFAKIATEVILDYYHDNMDVVKGLLRSLNYHVYRVLFERYGDDIIRYTINNFINIEYNVNTYRLVNSILEERDRCIYIRMLIQRLQSIGAKKGLISRVKLMYNKYISSIPSVTKPNYL